MNKEDLNSLSWPAMRYALGRKTYVVDTVCRALIRNANDIRNDVKERMAAEILIAVDDGSAGMSRDAAHWLMVVEAFGIKGIK